MFRSCYLQQLAKQLLGKMYLGIWSISLQHKNIVVKKANCMYNIGFQCVYQQCGQLTNLKYKILWEH